VIERIRVTIAHYSLTSDELFASATVPSEKAIKARGRAPSGKTKRLSVIRYRDEQGNGWTGHGQRPRWFKEAIAGGKTREELEVKN
jgi:DNA-binding protein H-NS